MSIVPVSMRSTFEAAGWHQGRAVRTDPRVPTTHPARTVLAELGGLTIRDPSPRVCAIAFQFVDEGALDVVDWEAALRMKMIGIAQEDTGHGELYMTERGHVIGCSMVHPAISFVGPSIQQALEAISRGEQSRPMLLSHQKEVTLYGVVFRSGDPAVIGPSSSQFD